MKERPGFACPIASSSMSATLESIAVVPDSVHREDPAVFVRWALGHLQIPVDMGDRDAVVALPEADRAAFAGQQRLRLPLAGAAGTGQESLAWDSRFGVWLTGRLRQSSSALHARPRVQPMGVNDIARTLYPAYKIDNGRVHLAGCQLTDHAFLRLSFVGDDPNDSIRHVFTAPDGSTVSEELVRELGLDELEPIVKSPPRLADGALRSLVAAGRRIAAKQSTSRDPAATTVEPLATVVVWVRHAEGRLQFTIGATSVSQTFSSWARLLKAQPFVARHSGTTTFHLAITDDDRIDAAEQIVACQHSGRRVLRSELVRCSVTGKFVLPDFTEPCPVSGEPALRQEFVACSNCRQRVSKAVLAEGVCSAARPAATWRRSPRMTRGWFGSLASIRVWTAGPDGSSPKQRTSTSRKPPDL
jgi:hypothetical protein